MIPSHSHTWDRDNRPALVCYDSPALEKHTLLPRRNGGGWSKWTWLRTRRCKRASGSWPRTDDTNRQDCSLRGRPIEVVRLGQFHIGLGLEFVALIAVRVSRVIVAIVPVQPWRSTTIGDPAANTW
jgi:hypothetical protein